MTTTLEDILDDAKSEVLTDLSVLLWIFATLLALKLGGDLDVSWRGVCTPVVFLVMSFAWYFGRAWFLTRREVRRIQTEIQRLKEANRDGQDT